MNIAKIPDNVLTSLEMILQSEYKQYQNTEAKMGACKDILGYWITIYFNRVATNER